MVLVFSHSGFSDTDANGITLKNLLSAIDKEQKAQFYCDTATPDFTAAQQYFRVTDVQMLKAFFFRKSKHIFTAQQEQKKAAPVRKISGSLKKRKYNFFLKWLRERLWCISPWGHRALRSWITSLAPDAIVYMVGESHFMDKLVLKTCKRTKKPLILYHAEAYRIIDLNTRRGLDRVYYRKSQKLYARLNDLARLIIYQSEPLQVGYEAKYPHKAQTMLAYNPAQRLQIPYQPNHPLCITYFGNLGVGRHESLIETANILQKLDPELKIDVYGKALAQIEDALRACEGIRFHGFLEQEQLREIIAASDILLHVESFSPEIMPKLRFAFSTKIAQCLASGRCFLSYAPETAASSQYLRSVGAPIACDARQLEVLLSQMIADEALRKKSVEKCLRIAEKNHDLERTAVCVREAILRLG